jgi:uncharacterized protein YsxB (DUF464 family)
MTTAEIYRLKDGTGQGFFISGHAQQRRTGVYDLICAAISAVAFTAVGALVELCGVKEYEESDGNLKMLLPKSLTGEEMAKAQVILYTLEIGLKQIARQYPRHIRVVLKEV